MRHRAWNSLADGGGYGLGHEGFSSGDGGGDGPNGWMDGDGEGVLGNFPVGDNFNDAIERYADTEWR